MQLVEKQFGITTVKSILLGRKMLMLISLWQFTLLFIIPRTVLLSSINLKLKPSTSQPTHFREIFRESFHHVNTNKGSVVKQVGNDVEGYRSQKVLRQLSVRVFLQYSVMQRYHDRLFVSFPQSHHNYYRTLFKSGESLCAICGKPSTEKWQHVA